MVRVETKCRNRILGSRRSSEKSVKVEVVHAWPEDCGNKLSDWRMDTPLADPSTDLSILLSIGRCSPRGRSMGKSIHMVRAPKLQAYAYLVHRPIDRPTHWVCSKTASLCTLIDSRKPEGFGRPCIGYVWECHMSKHACVHSF